MDAGIPDEINEAGLESEHDQYACDNWNLVSDEIEVIEDDQLEYRILT